MIIDTAIYSAVTKPLRILIIDDQPLFHKLIGGNAELLGYTWESANSFEGALLALEEAEQNKNPFAIATIDITFEVEKSEMPLGTMILQRIKSKYPHVACIVISGSRLSAQEVLDLRDEYDLDYYISKDRVTPKILDEGIKKALKRVKIPGNINKRRELLEEELETYRQICVTYGNNLALAELLKAKKGIDAGVAIENEINIYREELARFTEKVEETEQKLKRLSAS